MYVSVYSVTRHYGGPEEGGWWYDRSRFMHTHCFNSDPELAYAESRRLNEEAKKRRVEDGRSQGRYSVAGGADEVFLAEKVFGEHDNMDDPHPYYC